MNIIKSLIIALCVMQAGSFAQTYTLKQCLNYAVNNNGNIKIANLNTEIAGKKIQETIGSGLPQIDGSAAWTNNLLLPTTMLPGELMGRPGTSVPVKMGVKYNSSLGLTLKQKIVDPSFWLGLEAVQIANSYVNQNLQRTSELTNYYVSSAFYQAAIALRQMNNLKNVLAASEETLHSTELRYNTGVIKQVDVDKIRVSYNNTKSKLQQAELTYKQALNNLKYQMGLPMDEPLSLSDSLSDKNFIVTDADDSFNLQNKIDYQMQLTNLRVAEIQKKQSVFAYLPSLSFNASYAYIGMGQQFSIPKNNWNSSASIGLSLTVPIFSGFQRYTRVEQNELYVKIAKENLNLTDQSIRSDLSNYSLQFRNALDNIKNEKDNLSLAEKVYKNTQLDFQQGASSSLDVVQAESSLREAQNSYFSKLLTLYIAKLDLEKSKGTLIQFINNLE
ncbi:MAG: TolC family protein [Bacteroidota bacterium]|nr:TolC family protein [Bacteroidota bacterium]